MLIPLHAHGTGGTGSSASQLMALAFGAPLGAYLGGHLSARLGRYKPMIVAGTLLLPLALLALAQLPADQGLLALGVLLLCGVALGLQFPTALVAVQNAAPHSHLGVVTGVCGLFRGLGGALGVAVLTSLLWQLLPGFSASALSEVDSALPQVNDDLLRTAFAQLLLIDAAIALLPLLLALGLENRVLSGAR